MPNTVISKVYESVTQAHADIQRDFCNIDPVVGVNKQMRHSGIPADAMTIDCLKSNKRILLIFHDHQPKVVSYQFGYRDQDPSEDFESIALQHLTIKKLYDWMVTSFAERH